MKITGWKYDFSSLPRWDNREKSPWVYDEFFELPESDTLCCLYAINEVSMLNDQGFLAILKNKENPELVLNLWEGFTFCVNFSANRDGNLIFLQPNLFDHAAGGCVRPVLILDIPNKRFAYVKTANRSPAYKVIQKSKTVFVVEGDAIQRKGVAGLAALHGKKIRTRWLKWYELDRLSQLPQLMGFVG
jgi:hypothetical protein